MFTQPDNRDGRVAARASNAPPVRRALVFAIGGLALMMMSIDSTIVATVLPVLQRGLDTSINWAGWTITAYSFGFVLMLPISGNLAERAFDEATPERLVALNAARAAEEARGRVRWLRPAFQHPVPESAPAQAEIKVTGDVGHITVAAARKRQPWPRDTIEQVRAVAGVLGTSAAPLSVDEIAAHFSARGAWKKRLPSMLDMLAAPGRAREHEGRYSPL